MVWFTHALFYVSFCKTEANISLSEFQIQGARAKARTEWDKALDLRFAPAVQATILEPANGTGVIELCQELFTIKALIAEVVINPRDTQNSHFRSGHISLTVDGYMFGSLELLTFEGGDRDHADTLEHDFKVNSGGNFSLSSWQCLSDVCVSPGSLMPWQRLNLHIPDLACPGSHELRIHVHLSAHAPADEDDHSRTVVAAATSRFDLVEARTLARPAPRAAFPVGGMAVDAI